MVVLGITSLLTGNLNFGFSFASLLVDFIADIDIYNSPCFLLIYLYCDLLFCCTIISWVGVIIGCNFWVLCWLLHTFVLLQFLSIVGCKWGISWPQTTNVLWVIFVVIIVLKSISCHVVLVYIRWNQFVLLQVFGDWFTWSWIQRTHQERLEFSSQNRGSV